MLLPPVFVLFPQHTTHGTVQGTERYTLVTAGLVVLGGLILDQWRLQDSSTVEQALCKISVFILTKKLLGLVYFILSSYVVYLLTNLSDFSFTLVTDEQSNLDNIQQKFNYM